MESNIIISPSVSNNSRKFSISPSVKFGLLSGITFKKVLIWTRVRLVLKLLVSLREQLCSCLRKTRYLSLLSGIVLFKLFSWVPLCWYKEVALGKAIGHSWHLYGLKSLCFWILWILRSWWENPLYAHLSHAKFFNFKCFRLICLSFSLIFKNLIGQYSQDIVFSLCFSYLWIVSLKRFSNVFSHTIIKLQLGDFSLGATRRLRCCLILLH